MGAGLSMLSESAPVSTDLSKTDHVKDGDDDDDPHLNEWCIYFPEVSVGKKVVAMTKKDSCTTVEFFKTAAAARAAAKAKGGIAVNPERTIYKFPSVWPYGFLTRVDSDIFVHYWYRRQRMNIPAKKVFDWFG